MARQFFTVTFDVGTGATSETPIMLTGSLAAKSVSNRAGDLLTSRFGPN